MSSDTTVIKMESSSVTDVVATLNDSIANYKAAVVNASALFGQFQNALKGDAYTALSTQVTQSLQTNQLLVAECMTLGTQLSNFASEISEAESSVSFE
ncbi:hypothetical protein AB1395_03885 [Streptococcus pluranimalium]|uniref:hypothetical protein n=1 Tax=Streptococcus pluranimalium TaxID=82348 RepID=UPI0034650C4C